MNQREAADAQHNYIAQHPQPDGTPEGNLRHVIDVYAAEPDDGMVLTATRGVYGPDVVTGLTYGDLRRIAAQLAATAPTKCKHCGQVIVYLEKLQVGKNMEGWYLEYGGEDCDEASTGYHEPA